MENYKKGLVLFLILILSIGFVSASEPENDTINSIDDISVDDEKIASTDPVDDISVDDEKIASTDPVDDVSVGAVDTPSLSAADTAPVSSNTPNTRSLNGGTFNDIQKAINEMKDGDTLLLKGTFKTNGKPINVTKSITLKGNARATLDGKKTSSILELSAKNIIINGLNFINAKDDGAIISDYEKRGYAKYSILNCNFLNNKGGTDGDFGSGITTFENTILQVENCNFKNNHANYGPIYTYSKRTVIKNCNFYNNSAYQGGAISSFSPSLSILNSNFKNNKAYEGGCIYSEKKFSVKGSTFANNYADFGGVIFAGSSFSIANSKFLNNKAKEGAVIQSSAPCTISKSRFEKNVAQTFDIIRSTARLTILNSRFAKNKGTVIYSKGKITVKNSNFVQNMGNSISGTSYVANSNFYKNTDSAILGNTYVINSNFKYNKGSAISSGEKIIVKKSKFYRNTDGYGGAISCDACYVSDSIFIKNSATAKVGDDIRGTGGAIDTNKASCIKNCIFKNNFACYTGGAIHGVSRLTIANCKFLYNQAHGAGAVASYGISVKNSIFKNNKGAMGGAISTGHRASLVNCKFLYNRAYEGGAVHFYSATVKNCIFTRNHAYSAGGAINVMEKGLILNSKFIGNSVKHYGSAISLWFKSSVTIKKSRFSGNSHGKSVNPYGWSFFTYGNGMIVCVGDGPKVTAVKCSGLNMKKRKYNI